MKKYLVICYALHSKCVSSVRIFDTYDNAASYIGQDSKALYAGEIEYIGDGVVDIDMDYGYADVSVFNGESEWTWEIIEI